MSRAFLIFIFISFPFAQANSFEPQVIYGVDDRLEFFQIGNQKTRIAASATVILANAKEIIHRTDGRYETKGSSYGRTLNLCRDERFYNQRMVGFCTGVLVDKDLVLTAAHCIEAQKDCDNSRILLDFYYTSDIDKKIVLNSSQIKGCEKILKRSLRKTGADFALIKLKQPVTDRGPIKMVQARSKRSKLFMLGYPWGLPLKYVTGRVVEELKYSYTTNLDSSPGNSGSPVFDFNSGHLIGILTEGEPDLKKDTRGCRRAKQCGVDDCLGESVYRIESILSSLETVEY